MGMNSSTKLLQSAISNAIMKEFIIQGLNKHQALHAVLELEDDVGELRSTLHGALDSYVNYTKTYRIK
tara:strand:- start:1073 stop:1276 length:204 start_codon:yes stop_codon:yes gene_type:complete